MKQSNMKRFVLFTLMSLALINVKASYAFEFDNSILESLGFDNVDLSAFSGENEQFTGEYLANININNQPILSSQSIHFYTQEGESTICFTPELVSQLPMKTEVIKQLKNHNNHSTDAGECLAIASLDPAINIEFDGVNQVVDIAIPHKFIENYDANWVSPKNRDYGISGLILDYSLLSTYHRFKNNGNHDSNSSFRSYGAVGANIGRFRIRANYQYSSETTDKKFDWTQIYAFTDIGRLNSKFYAGELYSRSNVFDSVRFKGVSLFSDENMMPAYLRGYAPQITGTATSNAIVTIKQYGNVLQTVQVPPGPFVISDLPSYISGSVEVEVEESNGSVQQYQVDISQVPFLTRKGDVRYSANLGRLEPIEAQNNINTHFLSADVSYGLTNTISIFGGTVFTSNREYRALNAGIGLNLESFGAISFDITQSKNTIENQNNLSGHSYRINYAKRFGESTTLNLAGYRFSSREFTSLQNYIEMKSHRFSEPAFEKNRVTLSLSQTIPSINASFTASVTHGSYWNRKNISNYNISLNKSIQSGYFKNSSIQLSFMRNSHQNGTKENQIALFVNIPLDLDRNSRIQYTGNYYDASKNVSNQITYYTDAMSGRASVGIDTYHKRDLSGGVEYSLNASYDTDTRFGRLTTTADYSSDFQRATAGFDGSITLTQHGLATHPRVYENGARLIIDTGSSGVSVEGTDSISNIFGLVGISNIPAYYRSTYTIDNDHLPDDVEIQDSIMQLAVSDGAIAYRTTGAISGSKAISTITLADGSYPPFGAVVYRDNGKQEEVAMIAEQGLTYLTGLNNHTSFTVKWGTNQSCLLKIDSLDQAQLRNLTCDMK